jgi:hypothetical protein
MPYVSVFWTGKRKQRPTDPPHDVPAAACVEELGLRRTHYVGPEPPFTPSGNPSLDDYRDAYGTAINLKGDDAPTEWTPGWYVIPVIDLPLERARAVLQKYPVIDWGDW